MFRNRYLSNMISNRSQLQWHPAFVIILITGLCSYTTCDSNSTTTVSTLSSLAAEIIPSCVFGVNSLSILVYTRENPDGLEVDPNKVDQLNMTINPDEYTLFMVHGFISEGNNSNFYEAAQRRLTMTPQPIFSLDWSQEACQGSISMLNVLAYGSAVKNTKSVGELLGKFLIALHKEYRIPLRNIVVIGHSLGAHVSGMAGKHVYQTLGQKLGQIIGLDPAGPLYTFTNRENRLCKDDATLVQAHHSSALGIRKRVGHIDTNINGGLAQPSCGGEQACSHSFPVKMLRYSFCPGCNFLATPYVSGNHSNPLPESECTGDRCTVFGLSAVKFRARGIFSLKTTDDPPYCKASNTVSQYCTAEPNI